MDLVEVIKLLKVEDLDKQPRRKMLKKIYQSLKKNSRMVEVRKDGEDESKE